MLRNLMLRNMQLPGRAGWLTLILAVVICGLSSARVLADDELYSVSIDVPSRSLADRKAGAGAGLNVVLVRLSGLTDLPDSQALRRARSKPDRFYSQYRYASTNRYDELGQPLTELSLKFSAPAVRALMSDAELPLWTLNRPKVALWLAERSGGGTDILTDPSHPLLAAVLQRASLRGLPMVIPELSGIGANAVWNRERGALGRESERLGASIMLVGRAEQRGPDDWQVRWTTMSESDGNARNLQLAGTVAASSGRAVDLVADSLVNRFTVAGGAAGTLRLRVSNIDEVGDYAEVLKYLSALSYVENVNVSGLRGDELRLLVSTTGSAAKFLQLLRIDQRLTSEATAAGRAAGSLPRAPAAEAAAGSDLTDELRVAWQG